MLNLNPLPFLRGAAVSLIDALGCRRRANLAGHVPQVPMPNAEDIAAADPMEYDYLFSRLVEAKPQSRFSIRGLFSQDEPRYENLRVMIRSR